MLAVVNRKSGNIEDKFRMPLRKYSGDMYWTGSGPPPVDYALKEGGS
jgi:hypothetical protein